MNTAITQTSILNKLTTGHFIIDILVCIALPSIMNSSLLDKLQARLKIWTIWLYNIIFNGCNISTVVHRTIEFNYCLMGFKMYENPGLGEVQRAFDYRVSKQKETLRDNNNLCVYINDQHKVILTTPSMEQWINIDKYTRLIISKNTDHEKKAVCVIYKLEANCGSIQEGNAYLDNLVQDVYREYISFCKYHKGDTLYMYMPLTMQGSSSESEMMMTQMRFQKYVLSNSKTFDRFFHPCKEAVFKLVDQFVSKTGKFAVNGFPDKIGFLLHGPPGTGKTSFIKALANRTKRSIINVPLAAITTNQQLMQIMFSSSLAFKREGECDEVHDIEFNQVIYVIEDIDVATHVVKKRGPSSDSLSTAPISSSSISPSSSISQCKDALNMAGLLNVLDGIVDTPGRIVVMTTNHPEALDPALIRPGRINMQINLDYMEVNEASQMISHYMSPLTPAQHQELCANYPIPSKITPAALENICLEADNITSVMSKFHL